MPSKKPLSVLVLNGSLKHRPKLSNTEELSNLVIKNMSTHTKINHEIVRLSDKNIPSGLGFKEDKGDDWPKITKKIQAADIILFATPIWWGDRSSLMQRVIERFDAFDEEYLQTHESAIYNKVAGIVITGHEDGALATQGSLMKALTWFGFVLPPECAAYWVGEVGEATRGSDRARRLKNEATKSMAKRLARNLVYFALLLKDHPMKFKQ